MTMHVRVSGAWKEITEAYVRVSGVWKEITEGHVRVSGDWKQFYASIDPLLDATMTRGTDGSREGYSLVFSFGNLSPFSYSNAGGSFGVRQLMTSSPQTLNLYIRRVSGSVSLSDYFTTLVCSLGTFERADADSQFYDGAADAEVWQWFNVGADFPTSGTENIKLLPAS